jgi:hypothetical protein
MDPFTFLCDTLFNKSSSGELTISSTKEEITPEMMFESWMTDNSKDGFTSCLVAGVTDSVPKHANPVYFFFHFFISFLYLNVLRLLN